MRPFTSFVSRRLMVAMAVFAVIAAALISFSAVRSATADDSEQPITTVDLASDAQALDDALTDPAVALDESGPADPGDARSDWRQLREDLKAARELEGDARREALAAIRTKARSGAYGDRIERHADRRTIHRELFFSLLPDNLQADLTALKDAPADQRPELRRQILDRAVAGDYGPDVQQAAEKLQELRHG